MFTRNDSNQRGRSKTGGRRSQAVSLADRMLARPDNRQPTERALRRDRRERDANDRPTKGGAA